MELMNQVISLFLASGWIGAISVIMLESFLPMLPLVLLVMLVVTIYGFMGFIYAWIGMFIGSFVLFLLIRLFANYFRLKKRFVYHGSLKILACLSFIPFLPTFIIVALFALSSISVNRFICLFVASRGFICFLFATFGITFLQMEEHPIIFMIGIIVFIIFFLLARWMKQYFFSG